MRSRIASAVISFLMTATVTLFAVSVNPAHATLPAVSCTGSSMTTYDPPLTDEPQLVTVTADATLTCVSLSMPNLTAATSHTQFVDSARSCLTIAGMGPINYTYHWNTGDTSTVSGTRATTVAGAVVNTTVTGTVTSGLFEGKSFTNTTTAISQDLALCLLGLGTVANLTFTPVLTIV